MSAIGSKNGHLLNVDKNISFCKTDFSILKKPNKTGLRICIALCIHTGRAFYLVNNSRNLTLYISLNYNWLYYGRLKLFQECVASDIFYLQLIGSTLNNRNREQEVAECSRKGMGIPSVAKHRNGSTGRIYYSYNPSMSHITAFEPHPFPDVNATTAKQHLRRWIAYCKPYRTSCGA